LTINNKFCILNLNYRGIELLNRINYILDVGSSSLRLLATIKHEGKPRIVAEESVLYDGYIDGEFLSPDSLSDDLSTLIVNMATKMKKSITSIIVGVPSDFCVCICKRISRKYVGVKKLTENDLKNLYQSNANFGSSDDYLVISYSPMQCVLDDNVKTMMPIRKKTSSLTLDASYILVKKYFVNLMQEKLKTININIVDFLPTVLGQAMNCEPIKDDKKPIAIVDVGHITTSVCVYKGEGLALLSSFAMGGGHVSSDLMQVLNLSFKNAELIKRKVILTIENNKNEYYEVCSKGNLIKAPINLTNQVVKSRIEMIAKVIADILTVDDVFKDIDIYLTGDGIANYKGVKNIIKDATGMDVYDYKIPFNNSKDKFQTSKTGLVTLAYTMI